jgi:predicted ATPase
MAGSMALKGVALSEAIAHLNKGLDLISALPSSPERDGRELELRCSLGTAWTTLAGWAAQEVWDSLLPAVSLATSLHRNDALLPILSGLHSNVLSAGRIAESLRWVTQLMDAAEAYRDRDLLMVAYQAATNYYWLGELIKAREYADQMLSLYADDRHGYLSDLLGQDPKTEMLAWKALLSWMLGYPDQAVAISEAKDAHARRLGRPFDLGSALTVGARVFDLRHEPDEHLKRIQEAERVGRENSLPILTEVLVPIWMGVALIRQGQLEQGVASLRVGLTRSEARGHRINFPYWKAVLAEGIGRLGDVDGARDLIQESIAQVERPGWEERSSYAEILRIKGWLLACKDDLEGAERNYIASLDLARHQQAKSWELRTSTSYARLMREQGRVKEAYDLLAQIYGWFTEGFGTKDLQDAKALLLELG